MPREVEVLGELTWEESRRVGFKDGSFSVERKRKARSQMVAFRCAVPAGPGASVRVTGLRLLGSSEPAAENQGSDSVESGV